MQETFMQDGALHLIQYPSPILGKRCLPVKEFSIELGSYLDQAKEIMLSRKGIGIAANQVGLELRFFLALDKKTNIVREFINPEIIWKDGSALLNEGCLSLPGAFVQVLERANFVEMKAQDRNGEWFTVIAEGIEAVCLQHELDHLNGIFFLEKTSRQQRKAALKHI